MTSWMKDGAPSAGLFSGAVAWLISTQLNYALVPWVCTHDARWLVPALSVLLVAASLAGGYLSWRAWMGAEAAPLPDSSIARPRRFLAGMSVLGAVLFALVIASQGTAGLILQGCER